MVTLKTIVENPESAEKLNAAFADLRADFELDLETSKENIDNLIRLHVNTKNNLDSLASSSKLSSGVLEGLRGTGKTHLMLLSRHKINKKLFEERNFCVYINLKRFSTTESPNEDVFNRSFALFVIENIINQISLEAKATGKSSWLSTLLSKEEKEKRDFITQLSEAIDTAYECALSCLSGNATLHNIGTSTNTIIQKTEEAKQSINELKTKASALNQSVNLNLKDSTKKRDISEQENSSIEEIYFDISQFHSSLKKIISSLNLRSLIFYFDEWEKLYETGNFQRNSAKFINKIIDTPIYCWIAYVPYRGLLSPLSIGGDLQHSINLDKDLIIERSKADKTGCIEYFTDFINRRLNLSFNDSSVTCKTLINTPKKMELLILGSMGNTRDFGTILLTAWQNFKNYRTGKLGRGKPYQYISEYHIKEAIKQDGRKKLQNIEGDHNTIRVWNDIVDYINEKKYSHFAIPETSEKKESLGEREYSELFYQRILHIRKTGVEPKDTTPEYKLSILAPSFSVTQENQSKIKYVTESKEIDSRIRRYIFDPTKIINLIRVQEGRIHPCINCQTNINSEKMKAAWESNTCPFCGGNIYNKN
ncbi:hypothetical protein KUV74_08890 [Halomonas sp. DP1Y21-3]|uniref:hypothetical protein n=1 Tax=Halomonas sp. DP1Y21-3 TaxID=2859080 RepID=UPI001C964A60|nr:hypothetical protein [Halomonas sp. DP1Y21-3]MBY6110508.1 hypothetical protein [Halomonas sp. DP1Y21-3]